MSSGYYSWLKCTASNRQVANQQLHELIARIYWQHQARFGYWRIYRELLEEHDYCGSRERVRKQMKTLGLKTIIKRRFKVTTDSKHNN